jgi:hypothetical protein
VTTDRVCIQEAHLWGHLCSCQWCHLEPELYAFCMESQRVEWLKLD